MSQQGPILVVSSAGRARAAERMTPAAVVVAVPEAIEPRFAALAKRIAARAPYLPLIAVDPRIRLPENAIPFSQGGGSSERLIARLRAALRGRTLDSAVN